METFDVNSKIAQKKRKVFEWNSLPESRFYKKWQTSAIIWEISDSNLETGRNGSKSGVSRIIPESWQPCNMSEGWLRNVSDISLNSNKTCTG